MKTLLLVMLFISHEAAAREKIWIHNASHHRIDDIWCTPESRGDWGISDILFQRLYPGESVEIQERGCYWDCRAKFSNRREVFGYNLNVCSGRRSLRINSNYIY